MIECVSAYPASYVRAIGLTTHNRIDRDAGAKSACEIILKVGYFALSNHFMRDLWLGTLAFGLKHTKRLKLGLQIVYNLVDTLVKLILLLLI